MAKTKGYEDVLADIAEGIVAVEDVDGSYTEAADVVIGAIALSEREDEKKGRRKDDKADKGEKDTVA